METKSNFEIYTGPYIMNAGHAVVVITSEEMDDRWAKAEYFVLFSEKPDYLTAHAFSANKQTSNYPEFVIDVEFVKRFAKDSARSAIEAYLIDLHRTDPTARYWEYDVKLHREESTQALVTLHLNGHHAKLLHGIAARTHSAALKAYLAALRTLAIDRREDF